MTLLYGARTPAEQLLQLAGAKKAEVRLSVARNPSAPEGARSAALEGLINEAGPNKLMELADELGCPPTLRNRARARRWWTALKRADGSPTSLSAPAKPSALTDNPATLSC